MSIVTSLNARLAHDSIGSDVVEVVLMRITHPGIGLSVRLSSDATELLSMDPLEYGTISTWQNTGGEQYSFILISVLMPDDTGDASPTAKFVVHAADASLAEALRSTSERATVDIAVVMSNTPDLIEWEARGFQLVGVQGGGDAVTLSLSRTPITDEYWPSPRMTRARFPGLHP